MILIFFRIEQAKVILEVYDNPIISKITWMEILIGVKHDEQNAIKKFLDNFIVTELTLNICEVAISIRREYKIKIPDTIIWATAKVHNGLLITRNNKDFSPQFSDIKILY